MNDACFSFLLNVTFVREILSVQLYLHFLKSTNANTVGRLIHLLPALVEIITSQQSNPTVRYVQNKRKLPVAFLEWQAAIRASLYSYIYISKGLCFNSVSVLIFQLCENLMCKYKPKHLNEFICSLCMGYMIEATTVVECMHHCIVMLFKHFIYVLFFALVCRSCILLHIEKDAHCPSCGILINKFKLESALKLDHTLQLLIYKLIPTVYKEEILRRARFQVMNESPEEREKEFSNDYIRDLATHICSPYERVMFILEMKRPPRASITHREGYFFEVEMFFIISNLNIIES
ncbi:polycomb group RING finger protein 1 [Trichinella spiralis]|uniref:polycomb group RING finger protein 1 n=1 Tax=Trichinella spiralis TaxID=6334 RepID=UPI0001EFC3B6|nr:polycomb group RING finger protein 1 [Trichinella spiralis]